MPEENGRHETTHAVNRINYEHPLPTDGQTMGPNRETPPPPTKRQIRSVSIRELDHGYVVEVGCQTFAIESAHILISKLAKYILAPGEVEGKWAEGKLF